MKNFAFFICAVTLLASCNSNNASNTSSPQQKVMDLAEIAPLQRKDSLTADEICMGNFMGNTIKVHGEIRNNATLASYKDAVVKITYYSREKTVLGSKQYTIRQVFTPNSATKVEFEVEYYKGVNTIGWDVMEATAN